MNTHNFDIGLDRFFFLLVVIWTSPINECISVDHRVRFEIHVLSQLYDSTIFWWTAFIEPLVVWSLHVLSLSLSLLHFYSAYPLKGVSCVYSIWFEVRGEVHPWLVASQLNGSYRKTAIYIYVHKGKNAAHVQVCTNRSKWLTVITIVRHVPLVRWTVLTWKRRIHC